MYLLFSVYSNTFLYIVCAGIKPNHGAANKNPSFLPCMGILSQNCLSVALPAPEATSRCVLSVMERFLSYI